MNSSIMMQILKNWTNATLVKVLRLEYFYLYFEIIPKNLKAARSPQREVTSRP